MALSFPGESSDYRKARQRLLEREIELRRLTEAVAKERRELPPGGVVPEDYLFHGDGPVRLSELFEPGKDTLAIYSYMFGPGKDEPCRMCTPMLDGLDASAILISQRLTFAVVAESPPARLRAWKMERSWSLRLVSSAGTTYNRDYHGLCMKSGDETTMLNVFTRRDGTVRHFWGTELAHGPEDPGQDHRGLDPLNCIFSMFDLTPEGRGDFLTSLRYSDAALKK
jgi:predicted dithiol-disulfide oxidoreductase (DUF899 family)